MQQQRLRRERQTPRTVGHNRMGHGTSPVHVWCGKRCHEAADYNSIRHDDLAGLFPEVRITAVEFYVRRGQDHAT